MEKTILGIAGVTLGILGVIFILAGLVSYAVFPNPFKLIGGVFALIGAVFLLTTLMLVKTAQRFEKKMADLIVYGRKIEARIIEIKQNTSISVDGKHPYALVCEAEGRMFESEYFYKNVHRFDDKELIDVYLDDQSGEAYVDLES